ERKENVNKSTLLARNFLKYYFFLFFFAIIGVIGNSLISQKKSLPIIVWLPFDYHQPVIFETVFVHFSVTAVDTFRHLQKISASGSDVVR
ncbi:unnamed protein product, partial [Tenebrio molitor]